MNLNYKRLIIFVFSALLLLSAFSHKANAQEEAEFRLHPSSGWIKHGEPFNIDVLIDTKGQEVSLARVVLNFNPDLIQITQAQRNEDIFCDWPGEGQLIDNETGMVMATGFCNDPFYSTGEEEDVFVRLTLETLQEDELTINWEYSGRDEPRKSVIMIDGSPPQNILFSSSDEAAPVSGEYIISETDPGVDTDATTPDTGLFSEFGFRTTLILGSGVCFFALGAYILLDPKRKYFNNSRTVVVYEEEERT